MWFFKMLWEMLMQEGYVAERFFIFFITFCLVGVLVWRRLLEFLGADSKSLEFQVNMANTAHFMCIGILAQYILIIYITDFSFNTFSGLYSDGVIFLFRILYLTLVFVYFVYLHYETTKTVTFYTYEYYFLILVAVLGLSSMVIASNFFNLLIFMEIYSIAVYFLIHDKRGSSRSAEAAYKYFVVSSFSTAFFIFGIFFVYFSRGALSFIDLAMLPIADFWGTIGYFFIAISLCVKMGASLFFFWIADTYDGANYSILMFLNLFVKPVFVIVLFKLLTVAESEVLHVIFRNLLFGSLIVGIAGAVSYTKIKRFLIFTSIYNIGFFSCFFWDPTSEMLASFIFFFSLYTLNSLALMALIGSLRDGENRFVIVDLKDLSGVLPANEPVAMGLIILFLSLSGLPPFSLFYAKYLLFVTFFSKLAIGYFLILLVASAYALFYYIRLIRVILSSKRPTVFISMRSELVAFIVAAATVLNIFGFFLAESVIERFTTFVSYF